MVSETSEALLFVIAAYLSRTNLPKAACFTNYVPTPDDIENFPNLNYICYSMPSLNDLSSAHFEMFKSGYRRLMYDALVSPVEPALVRRQFGYVCLKLATQTRGEEVLAYLASEKHRINRKYPILTRMLGVRIDPASLPTNVKFVREFKLNDAMYEVT